MASRCTHLDQVRHPLIHSFEPGESWAWCYADAVPLKRSTVEAAGS